MAQLNRNVNYINTVDGITIWERLRVIRGFLEDRRLALKVGELELEKFKQKQKDLEVNKANYSIDEYFEVQEVLLLRPQSAANLLDAKREIKFLEDFEKTIAAKAEETRVPGKTDEDMYEINYFEELIQIHLLKVQSQLMATGRIDADMMRTLILNKASLDRAIGLGLLDTAVKDSLSFSSDINILGNAVTSTMLEQGNDES